MSAEKLQKVLIVDDEPRNLRIIAETLEGVADFVTASSGEEALEQAEKIRPALILLDIMMPGIDGYEVCRRLRTNPALKYTHVILVSGKAMIEERLQGYAVGADDYMTKPFVSEELLAKAKVFLKLAAMETDLETQVHQRTKQLLDAEAKLIATAKMAALGEMAGGIAHEINTPLATITLITHQLTTQAESGNFDAAKTKKGLEMLSKTIQRISGIVLGLRTFSRDGSNDIFDFAKPEQIIESTLNLCTEKLKNAGVTLTFQPSEPYLMIRCRAVQISQVLLNLVTNACDAIADQSEKWIDVRLEQTEATVKIVITDSGKGIPQDVRDKLFQPFFTTKEIGKGTGLGLSVSLGIVEAHKGHLTIDETCPNTRFVIELPKHLEGQGSEGKVA